MTFIVPYLSWIVWQAMRLGVEPPISERKQAQRQARWTGGVWLLLLFFVPVSKTVRPRATACLCLL